MDALVGTLENAQITIPSKIALEKVQIALNQVDWDEHWQIVEERVAQEVDAYAVARARSWDDSTRRMLR